ncbi:kinase-like protein [Ascobolus immersus RN42]|uniref:Kinase-like protein n=1 Tax=Ascobolus immersus RN42 TaxID=1160509 RepID=A0A3N4IU95_ASCIM|nr:kinase-like protein [Ascobolus immersus RN42]
MRWIKSTRRKGSLNKRIKRNSHAPNNVCADDFEKIKVLGKGTYGTVILVRHKPTGKLYAQKQLKKATVCVSKRLVGQTMSERAILEAVRHPFIVNLYYAFQDHEKLYLILEYAQGGELFWHLAQHRTFTEPMAAFYLACLALALHHLHTKCGVVYRDLKPENCLLDHEGYLLLTDFGLSKIATDDNRCTSLTGTPEYMAPEVIREEEYDHAVDWWALGTLMYDLLTGGTPFVANNATAIRNNVLKKKVMMPYYLSADAKSLLKGLLDRNPKKRLGANLKTDFEKIKKHRFFRTVDWKKLERRELKPPIRPTITDPAAAENFSCDFTKLGFSVGPLGPDSPLYVTEEGDAMFGGFSYKAPGEFFRH